MKIRVYGTEGGVAWEQESPGCLRVKMDGRPVEVWKAGVNSSYLSDQTLWNLRLPAGHPEGYIEAFANIYRNVAHAIHRLNKVEDTVDPGWIDYPTIHDGVRGMQFIERVIESATGDQKWIRF